LFVEQKQKTTDSRLDTHEPVICLYYISSYIVTHIPLNSETDVECQLDYLNTTDINTRLQIQPY